MFLRQVFSCRKQVDLIHQSERQAFTNLHIDLEEPILQILPGGEYQLEVVFLDGRVPGTGSTTFEIATVITGLPESDTLTIGQNVSWTPAPAGGV